MMMSEDVSKRISEFDEKFIDDLKNKLSGTSEEFDEFVGDWPSDLFPAGNLSHLPRNAQAENYLGSESSEDVPEYMRSSYSPPSMGAAIYHSKIGEESVVELSGDFYTFYTVFPTIHELKEYNSDDASRKQTGLSHKLLFPRKFVRTKIRFTAFQRLSELPVNSFFTIPRSSIQVLLSDPSEINNLVLAGTTYEKEISSDFVLDEGNYHQHLDKINQGEIPSWDFEIVIRRFSRSDIRRLDVFLVNRTDSPPIYEKHRWSFDPFLFAPHLVIMLKDISLEGIRLEEIEGEDYRYATEVVATGRNCHVKVDLTKSKVETEIFPIFDELKTEDNDVEVIESATEFLKLGSSNPIFPLKEISKAMHHYLKSWESKSRDYIGNPIFNEASSAWSQMSSFKSEFEKEVRRFDEGIETLSDPRLLLAFQLTNQAFYRRFSSHREEDRPKWRLFQLVFVVSALTDLLARELQESQEQLSKMKADLISFPTGAGKTEAFTGVVIVQAFYDRLRGKNFGVSAWMKFPLRFLTLQQLERALLAIDSANIVLEENRELITKVREEYNLGSDFESFSVGYFVGGTASPNDPSLDSVGDSPLQIVKKGLPKSKDYLVIENCSRCRLLKGVNAKIKIEADLDRERLNFVCTECGITLPFMISDTEIYSNIPTMLISTIDKGAVFGHRAEAQTLFGVIRKKCRKHGYSPFNKCWKKGCKEEELLDVSQLHDFPPSIVIQDEIHMLEESLGTISAIYETFLLGIAHRSEEYGSGFKGDWKIIASSATISGYREHMIGLYLKDSILFPARGPAADESFYFKRSKSEVKRKIIGFSPHNMTHPNAVVKSLQYYVAFRRRYFAELPDSTNIETQHHEKEWPHEILPFVTTAILYGNVKSEIYQIEHSVDDQINPFLINEGLKPIEQTADLTGDTSTPETSKLMGILTNGTLDIMPELLVATSSISHGVDLERLNFMAFRGQPRNIAEFIQTYSRIGRKYQGIVLVIYNPNRERDSTHYMMHNELLSVGNILIPPPSIDRYSYRAMDKCVDGILFGNAILGQCNKSLLFGKNFIEYISNSEVTEKLLDEVANSYYPRSAEDFDKRKDSVLTYARNMFANRVKSLINEFNTRQTKWTGNLLKTMYSLRQTDTTVEMVIDDSHMMEIIRKYTRDGS